jgi:hypothetical protein
VGQSRHFDRGPAPSGLPRSTDIVRPPRHVGLVPVAAIEDEGTILYSIVTCFLPNAPKSILVEEDTRGSEMLAEPIAYCFYHYRRLFFHTWIVTTFTIIMAAAPLQASVTPKASACGYLAGLIDKAPPGPLFLPSYPTVESGPLHGAAYLYDNAVAAIALVGCGEQTKRIGLARRFSGPSITTAPGMMDGSGTLTPRAWWRMAPSNFRGGGTILRTNG